jgi:Kyanoviridae head maturation protease
MTKNLLTEYIPLEYDLSAINEAAQSGSGTIRIKGVFQRANEKNQNGRVYPKAILEREAQKYMSFVNERRALGELDHPESPIVNLKNVSHNVIEMHWEGDDLCGTMEILSTPSGNIVRELMRNRIRLGVSSRGVGSIIETTQDSVEVDDDFNLICFDIVSNPSTHGAFLAEGVNNALFRAKVDRVNTLIGDFFGEIGGGI